MATDYRDDTLSADRYIVQPDAPVSTKETRTMATYTGTNVNHPRFPQYRKDMTAAQKRAHTKAGRPRKAAPAPAKVAPATPAKVVTGRVPSRAEGRKPGTPAEIVRTFSRPLPGLSRKCAALAATLLATPANVTEAQWLVLDDLAQTPAKFDVVALRAALGTPKAARKAA